PVDLGSREVGIEQQASSFGEQRLVPLRSEMGTGGSGAAILPDDGVVNRFAGLPIPNDNACPSIGYADGRVIAGRYSGFFECEFDRSCYSRPNFFRVMLHPAVFGKNLFELALADTHNFALVVKYNRAAGCRSLVYRKHISCHLSL